MTTPHDDPERVRREIEDLRERTNLYLAGPSGLARSPAVTEAGKKALDVLRRYAQEAVDALEEIERESDSRGGLPLAFVGGRLVLLDGSEHKALSKWDAFEERWRERSDS